MIEWIEKLEPTLQEPFKSTYPMLKHYWLDGGPDFDENQIRDVLWSWVDNNGGSTNSNNKYMNVARMVLCLAYKNHEIIDELQDMGFFNDLLANYGISRKEINKAKLF